MTNEELFKKIEAGKLTRDEHRAEIVENLEALNVKIKNELNKDFLSFWISQAASNLKEAQRNELFDNEMYLLTFTIRETINVRKRGL